MRKRIGIIGASGFVGSTLVERALARDTDEIVPIIHSSGNAGRLARWGVPLVIADILDKQQLADALRGCTHIVNCSRNGKAVMLKGVANLLEISADLKIQGFVHLSSVMVHGDPPAPCSITEAGETKPVSGSYGWIKLKQDELIQKAKATVPSTILCPPNIGGAYSGYFTNVYEAVRTDRFALMNEGEAVCCLVDVQNLCHAIELALDRCTNQALRLFVTDDEPTVWRDLVAPLAKLADRAQPIRKISEQDLRKLQDADRILTTPKKSIIRSLKHLVSSEVRESLRKDPLLAKSDFWLRQGVAKLGAGVEDVLRHSIEGPRHVIRVSDQKPLNLALTAQQLRGVGHSCELAKKEIGYRPQYSFIQSMNAFERWYKTLMGINTDYWDLLRLMA